MAEINSPATGSRWAKVSLCADPPCESALDISWQHHAVARLTWRAAGNGSVKRPASFDRSGGRVILVLASCS
jgi:hypothetical protein